MSWQKDPTCIFCQIVDGERPAKIVYEDHSVIAFLDAFPAAPTHNLIIPRKHIPSLNQLEEGQADLVGHMFIIAARLALEQDISDSGYRLIINTGLDANQSVFHLHLHLLGGRPMRYPMG